MFDIKQYEIAFLSIQRTPVRAFERDKRNRISRRILQVLLGKSLPTFTLLEDHIALLTGYLSTSHRFQNLLISTKGNEIFEGEPTGTPIDRAPLISLAQKLDSEMETEISRLVAFRRFVYYFFRYFPFRFPNPVQATKTFQTLCSRACPGRKNGIFRGILRPASQTRLRV